jgi:hypothetical protein
MKNVNASRPHGMSDRNRSLRRPAGTAAAVSVNPKYTKRPPPGTGAAGYPPMFQEHQPCDGACRCSFSLITNFVWRLSLKHLFWAAIIILVVWKLGISETVDLAFKWAMPAAIGNLVTGPDKCGPVLPPVSLPPHTQPPQTRRPQPPRPHHQKMHGKAVFHPRLKCGCG